MADSVIEEIKRRLDIVDVVGQTVDLKRTGKSFKGLCPFHSEKTPSFTVSPERGTYHCFGCGEGGDVFSFLQRRENLDFREALEELGRRAGVEVERGSTPRPDSAARAHRERLLQLVAAAADFYRAELAGPRGARARASFEARGVSAGTIDEFGLGYAEPSGRALERHLVGLGYSRDEAVKAGALGRADDGRTYDRFRDRLMFAIRDAEGRTIAFGGRALQADQQPKYLNSPESELFDKGANLYALDRAATAIRETRRAIVVEGYMDALIAHQHGFRNVVATLGTAIGERHIQILRRLASEVVLALDADAAGVKAAIRGFEVAGESLADESPTILRVRGLGRFFGDRRTQIKAMLLPAGRDPDDVIRADPAHWERLAAEALPVVDFVLQRLKDRYDLGASVGQRAAAREAMTMIQDLPDPVERAHYIQRLARLLNTREEFLLQAAETRPRRHAPATPAAAPVEPPARPEEQLQDYVLALVLRAPADAPRPDPSDFASAPHRAILGRLAEVGVWPDPTAAIEWLSQGLGPAFEETIQRLRAADAENERLGPEALVKELRVRTLELRKLRLFGQYQALDSVLRDEADPLSPPEQREYVQRLVDLADGLMRVMEEQRELGVVGTASWSIRRGQEVLGG